MPRHRRLRMALALGAAWMGAPGAGAESGLRLAAPEVFGRVPAATYDARGARVGAAHLSIEKLEGGHVRIYSESGIEGGARTVAVAELQPVGADGLLQLVSQESRSFRPDGTPLGVLRIDHLASAARCADGNGNGRHQLALPAVDRVANVPMNLLFLPLVHGQADDVNFQLFLCRGARPRLVDFRAHVARREAASNGHPGLVEVRYAPDFGSVLSIVARSFVPRLSFWFDPEARNPWLAHRVPLYASGPEVTVIRAGVPPDLLEDGS